MESNANQPQLITPAESSQLLAPSQPPLTVLPASLPLPESTVPAPPQPGQVFTGSMTGESSSTTPDPKQGGIKTRFSHKKMAIIAGAVAAVVVIGAAAYYFGYYKNSNFVYKQSLKDTATAYSRLVDYYDSQSAAAYKDVTGSGSYKFSSSSFSTDGTLTYNGNTKDTDTTFDVGLGASRVSVEARTILASGQTQPDVYLKASGINGLGALLGTDELDSSLNQLDGKWIAIDHSLLETLQNETSTTKAVTSPPTKAEIVDELQAFGDVNKQYIFSTSKSKGVTTVLKTYGLETVSGHKVYHYKVALVKDHVKAYITAQRDALKASKLGAWLKQNNYDTQVDDAYTSLEASADTIKATDTLDVWSDINSRVIYKVRISDPANAAANYVDVGLDYKNGDTYPFFVSGQNKDGSGATTFSLGATLDSKANSLGLNFVLDDAGSKASGNFTLKPATKAVSVTAPQGALPLSQVLDQLGLSDLLSGYLDAASPASTITPSTTADDQRQADIKSLQAQVESSFVENGYYPTLAELNSASWRKANLSSLTSNMLTDPQSSSQTLASSPAAHVYAYQPKSGSGGSCDNNTDETLCASYTLTATLSNGQTYVKTALD